MKIRDFFIKGFGIYEKVQINSLSPEINLFLGDNEAGKSTLLAFFRDILFGFESGRGAYSNSYKPIDGASHGGRITLVRDMDQKPCVIERTPGKGTGTATVTMGDGSQKGEDALRDMLQGVDKEVYRNIYGFSLEELQNLGTLSAESVKGKIYSAGAGTGQKDIMKIDDSLGSQMEKLFKPRGSTSTINKLFSDMEKTEGSIKDLSSQSDDYSAALKKIPALQDQIRDLDVEISKIDDELAIHGKILDSWDQWEELNNAQNELNSIPLVERFPEKGLDRYEVCKENLAKTREDLDRLTLDIESKHKEKAELQVDMRLLSEKVHIDEIMQGKDHYQSALRDLPEIKSQEERINAEIEKMINNCGKDWTEAKVMAFDISMPVRDQVNRMEAAINNAVKELEALKNRLIVAKSTYDKEEATLLSKKRSIEEIKSAKTDEQSLKNMENAVRQARQSFSNIAHLKDTKESRSREVQKLQDDKLKKEHSSVKSDPARILDFVIGLILIGVAIYFYKSLAVTAIALGVIGVLILFSGYKSAMKAKKDRDDLKYEIDSLKSQIEMGENELKGLDSSIQEEWGNLQNHARILGMELKTVQDVDEADNAVRKLRENNMQSNAAEREYYELCQSFELTKKDYQSLLKEKDEKTHVCDVAMEKWVNWLRQNYLPSDYTPGTVRDLFRQIETIRDKRNEANGYHLRVEKMLETIEGYESQIKDLLSKCERQIPDRSQLVSALLQLREDLNKSQTNYQKLENLEEALMDKTNDQKTRSKEMKRYQQEEADILHAADAQDENDFLERSKWYITREELNKKIRECNNQLQRIAGDLGIDRLYEILRNADLDKVEKEKRELEEEKASKRENRDNIIQDMGKYKKTIEGLERSDDLSTEIAKRESQRTELNRIASEWAILAMCRRILKETRDRYEREKQPDVIKSASEVIRKMTNGAYDSVFTPLGENKFELLTPSGERKDISILSRGTREQLYLAIRFGFIKEYAGEPLPVIMDDILVNFDPKRAKAAAECILDLSRSHQVLFFTCHPQINDLFLEMKPDIVRFDISGGQISRN